MTIATVITEGFGSFGTIGLVVTSGYSQSSAAPAVTGLRRYKKYGKGYVKRDDKVLVFESQELADKFVSDELDEKLAQTRKQKRAIKAATPKPVDAIEIAAVEQKIQQFQLPEIQFYDEQEHYHLLAQAHYKILEMQDEEDLSVLLAAIDDDAITQLKNLINFASSRYKQ